MNYRTKVAGLESKLLRRQQEFEKSEESFRAEINRLEKLVDRAQYRLNSDTMNTAAKENCDVMNVDSIAHLHYKMGNLTANYDRAKDEISRLENIRDELDHEVKQLKEELESAKEMNKLLEKEVSEQQGNKESISQHYTEEIDKIKKQKAEIRYELYKLKKEYEKVLGETLSSGKSVDGSDREVEKYENELANLKKKNSELMTKVDEQTRHIAEVESSKDGEINQLKKDLLSAKDEIEQRKKIVKILEEQCDKTLVSFLSY